MQLEAYWSGQAAEQSLCQFGLYLAGQLQQLLPPLYGTAINKDMTRREVTILLPISIWTYTVLYQSRAACIAMQGPCTSCNCAGCVPQALVAALTKGRVNVTTVDINSIIDLSAMQQSLAQLAATVERPDMNAQIQAVVNMIEVRRVGVNCWLMHYHRRHALIQASARCYAPKGRKQFGIRWLQQQTYLLSSFVSCVVFN